MSWVYAFPLWLVCVVFIGGISLLACSGLFISRRRRGQREQIPHNDVAGPVLSTIGTVLAVVLSFIVVVVWQQYDQAGTYVEQEAGNIIDLYHESWVLPQPVRGEIQAALRQYVDLVVHKEWPLMRQGQSSDAARLEAVRVIMLVETFQPRTIAQQNAQADALHHAHAFSDFRRDRLFDNSDSVPLLVWAMMFLIAAITIAAIYLFTIVDFRIHFVMTTLLAVVIGAMFVIIAELDLPFRGENQIPPTALMHAYQIFAEGYVGPGTEGTANVTNPH
jgi:hypothetical protein